MDLLRSIDDALGSPVFLIGVATCGVMAGGIRAWREDERTPPFVKFTLAVASGSLILCAFTFLVFMVKANLK